MTKIKICGITNLADAIAAVEAGADALGFVFYQKSPRYIHPVQAQQIIQQLPPFIQCVGLFVNYSQLQIEKIINQVDINLIQYHGDEPPEFCESIRFPYIKAVRVQQTEDILQAQENYSQAKAILLDAYKKGIYGGTGETFLWNLIPAKPKLCKPIILAGGLNGTNIAEAIKTVSPYAVDVSGGVEVSKGIKDHQKITMFCQFVHDNLVK